jgi:hypothetical protein
VIVLSNKPEFPIWPNLGEKTAKIGVLPWDWDVTEEDVTRVRSMNKPDRKKYMERTDVSWNVYSAAKGENWYHPISNENPPFSVMAFVADYDLPIDFTFVEAACKQTLKLHGWCPTHIETSLSKHIRCVWLFQKPVLCTGKKFADEFLKRVGALVGADAFLPGIDRKSYDVAMRWTNGGYWHELDFARPVPADVLVGIAVKTQAAISTKKSDIPLEKASELLLEKYPNFAKFGVLKQNAVGLRFWDEKADNPNGAMCVDRGFACVTGDKPLMTWEELLGKNIVEKMRLTNYGEVSQDMYFDGKSYWVKKRELFYNWDRQDTLLRIAAFGYERSRQKGESQSAAELILSHIHETNRIDGAAPLLYRPEGVVDYQNNRVLNISRGRPLAMADKLDSSPDDFPWMWSFFNVFFARPDLRPLDHFLIWWRRFYESAIKMKPTNGHAVFICGPRECGKNLVSELILPVAMGGMAPNPYRYLMGETDFSDDIFASPIMAINDEDAPPEHKKTIFEQKIKALVANNEHSYHPKFMKKVRITWDGRLIVTLNDGPKDVGLLPMLNPNTVDRLHFFRAQRHDHEFFDKQKNREIVERELPFLLRWLVDTYKAPTDLLLNGRFGMKSFHDPELVKTNRQEQISYNLLELLGAWMQNPQWNGGAATWTGTPTDLLRALSADETLEILLKTWDPTKLGRALGDLARGQTPGVSYDPAHKSRRYVLSKAEITATVQGLPMVQKAVTQNLNLQPAGVDDE